MSIALLMRHRQVTPPSGGGGGTDPPDNGGGGTTNPPPIATPSDPPILVGQAAQEIRALVAAAVEAHVSYELGQTMTTKVTFRESGSPIDPPTVVLTVTTPAGVQQQVTGGFLHRQVGEYVYDIDAAARGAYVFKWTGSGTIADRNGDLRRYTAVTTRRARVT